MVWHKYFIVIVSILAVMVVIAVREDTRVLGRSVSLVLYPNGGAMVQVHYRRDGAPGLIRITLDGNDTVIDSYPARPQLYWNSNYYFRSRAPIGEAVFVRVTFQDDEHTEVVERRVIPRRAASSIQPDDFRGVATPTHSMTTQWRPSIVDAPDSEARISECAPTAAANSLIALAKQHGEDERLPASTFMMIDELKREMRWTSHDGVMPEQYVTGANFWARAKGLEVITEKVGRQDGRQTLHALAGSLATGNGAQVRLSFSVASGGKQRVVGGHLVTVVGIHEFAGKTFIDIHDPRSPRGVDTYRVDGTTIIDYVLFPEALVTISWGFTQTWTGGTMALP